MISSQKLFLFCLFFVLTVLVPAEHPKIKHKKEKSRKKDHHGVNTHRGFKKTSPDPVLRVNAVPSAGVRDYTLVEDYEQSLQDMVNQLLNSSEPAGSKCEVNLRLWVSNKRSLSPWTYSINHDEHRIPVDIPEARCLCSGCINPFTMQEDRTMSSIPIYSKIPVKRQLCHVAKAGQKHKPRKKCRKYESVMENVAVGCTCIL
ncbi:interleukin-17B [Microcaecilia unicolor]|uniref:Interleukin-17B n=1 Tax=Microcaecilia unicolor TaxID=1415580 RepID=A0A6P7YW61_9AMPH|nr:interleukin-17B [Microcaecilia unicolor]